MTPALTILITTKNRGDSVDRLMRTVRSQQFSQGLEVIVVDDGSEPAIKLEDTNVRLVRNDVNIGACASRNRGLALATAPMVVLFDDDVELPTADFLQRALDLAQSHPDYAAIGFRHLEADGTPKTTQPAACDVLCETAYFYGYGVIFRRDPVLQIGGFETSFGYGYEEQDMCMKLHRAGWRVMFSPDLSLIHHHDSRERDWTRTHRLISRNAIRSMLLRFPAISVIPAVIAKWISFFFETHRRNKTDWAGAWRMAIDTLQYVPYALRHRQPMTTRQLVRFKQLRNHPIPLNQLVPA
jgi:GT2 family glycosyltransferase